MTKKMTNLLVLISVLALASCGGSAPTGPSDPVLTSDDSGAVSAMTVSTGGCQAVTGIDLKADDSSRTVLWVQATYQFINYDLGTCPAPRVKSEYSKLV